MQRPWERLKLASSVSAAEPTSKYAATVGKVETRQARLRPGPTSVVCESYSKQPRQWVAPPWECVGLAERVSSVRLPDRPTDHQRPCIPVISALITTAQACSKARAGARPSVPSCHAANATGLVRRAQTPWEWLGLEERVSDAGPVECQSHCPSRCLWPRSPASVGVHRGNVWVWERVSPTQRLFLWPTHLQD